MSLHKYAAVASPRVILNPLSPKYAVIEIQSHGRIDHVTEIESLRHMTDQSLSHQSSMRMEDRTVTYDLTLANRRLIVSGSAG